MDEQLLKKRILELRKRAEFSCRTEFTDFLTLSEIDTAKTVLSGSNHCFYGGLTDTERQMLCIAPEDVTITPDLFPICGVRIMPRNVKFAGEISHRDVLGSVLGLGLTRDVIGDIFIKDKEAYVLCAEHIAGFLTEQLTQVRHTNVVCKIEQANDSEFTKDVQVISRTVSAIRLDSVAAAAFGVSRSSVASAISCGKIFINGKEITSPSASVKAEDVLSFRGQGKAKLKEIGSLTKKGRIVITIERYQ